MDLTFTPQDLAFQAEVREWITATYTPKLRAKMALSKNGYLDKAGQLEWQHALYAKGWAAPDWPVEHGGPGWTSPQRVAPNPHLWV
jgi:alkylation response protein AidB-like acyl-CoA dehydrogenase